MAAMSLKRAGLRSCSGPFDWVFADLWIVKDCIESRFKTFMDRSKHIPDHSSKAGHLDYGRHFFEHHNVTDDSAYNHYVRCVNRFNSVLASTDRKLFLICAFKITSSSFDEYVCFYNWFKTHTSNFLLVVILIADAHESDDDSECSLFSHDDGGLLIKTFRTQHGHNGHSMRDIHEQDTMLNFLRQTSTFDLSPLSGPCGRDPFG